MRRLAITRRVSLDGISDGWDAACYAVITPASNDEYLEFMDLQDSTMTPQEKFKYQINFVKKHLVSGKVKILNDANELVLDDLLEEDIDSSKELSDRLAIEVMGLNVDPKGLKTPTETSPIQAPSTDL